VLEVLYHCAKFGWAPISPATVCLSVCPSRFWTSEIVRPISPWRRWSTETILMPLDRGRFVVMYLCSTFSLRLPLTGDTTKCLSPKIGVFRHQRATEQTDRDEIWHVKVHCGSALVHQIWPSSVHEPPNIKICPKIVVFGYRKPTQWTHSKCPEYASDASAEKCYCYWSVATSANS